MTRDQILGEIRRMFVESFELEGSDVRPDSELYGELGLDSIDAVDIFVQLRELTGRRPDPEVAKQIRTVEELITFVEKELDAARKGLPEPEVAMPKGA
jgi:acyl carrier protein